MESLLEIRISAKIGKSLYAKILERQREAKRKTGFEPTVSTVIRTMLEEAANGKRR